MIELAGLAAGVLALFLSAAGTSVIRRKALAWGFVARPQTDRHHRQPTPLGGGVAIFLAIALPTLLVLAMAAVWHARPEGPPAWAPRELTVHLGGIVHRSGQAMGILAGAAVLMIIGLIDDRRRMGPWLKLAAQVLVATAVVVFCDVRLLEFMPTALSVIASVLWIVLITNALNLLDNMDGLAAGVAAICAAALLAPAVMAGEWFVAGWLVLLCGAAAGFLIHNFPPAKIFMGDAGAMVLGYFLAVLAVLTTYHHADAGRMTVSIFTPVVLLAVPLYDTFSVITLRLAERRNPMVGDTRHFSHRLLRRGMSPRKAVLTIYLATAATAVGASILPQARPVAAGMVFGQTVGIVLLIALLESADARGKP